MKKRISIIAAVLLIAATSGINTGCVKSSGGTTVPAITLPDISNFSIQAVSDFVAGATSLVSIASSTLADGAYTIHFDLSGANTLPGQTASLNVSGGNGSFSTPVLASPGNTNITVTSITNSSGGNSSISANNTKAFTDSTGLMTCKINGNSYRAIHVDVSLPGSGGILSIHGVLWNPLTTITLNWDNYATGTIGTRSFNANDNNPGSPTSLYNGGAMYSARGIADLSQHGSITILTTSPLLTGTFTFVNQDSSQITSGSFSGKAP